jgi:hypothetical protein
MNRRVRAFGVVVALVPTLLSSVLTWTPNTGAGVAGAGFGSLGVAEAQAQEDAVTKEARKRFQEGVKLFDEKKFDLARASFLQAMALKPHPAILLNLAQTELVSGLSLEALGHFKQYLNDPATQGDPKRADAERGVAEARAKLPRAQVSVDMPGAEIFVDNVRVGTSPMGEAIDLKPGNHTFEAKKDGKSARSTVDPAPGKITMVDLALNPGAAPVVVPPPVPPAPGTAPTAAGPVATAAPAATSLPPQEPPSAPTPSSPGKWAAVGIVGGGIAVVGLGLGVGMLISANAKDNDVASISQQIKDYASKNATNPAIVPTGRQNNPCATPIPSSFVGACDKLVTKRDERDSAQKAATTGFVIGGIGAAVGIFGGVMYLRAKKAQSESAASLQLAPIVSPSTQGLSLIGRF